MAVSERNTKADILSEVNRLKAQIKAQKAASLNPAKIKKTKRKQEVKEKTKDLSLDAVEKSASVLRTRITSALQDIEGSLTEKMEMLKLLDEELTFKQEEVDEIYGIEQEATTLAALLEAQEVAKEKFEKESEEKREAFAEMQRATRNTWTEEKQEYLRVQQLDAAAYAASEQRKQEELAYAATRDERKRMDDLSDSLALQSKNFQAECEAENKLINDRLEDLVKRENTMADLEDKVSSLEADLVVKIEEAVAKAKAGANTSNAIAQSALKREQEAQLTVLNGKLESAREQLVNSQVRVGNLESDLQDARKEVQQIALGALNAQSGKAALDALQTSAAQQGTSKK